MAGRADRGQLLPSFLLADHLQIENKSLSSDIYYRENEYTEKLYIGSMQDLSKAGLSSAF